MSDDATLRAELTEHNRRIADAWGAGHELALARWGDAAPGYFCDQKGNELMAALQALPVGTPAEEFTKLVTDHVAKEPV